MSTRVHGTRARYVHGPDQAGQPGGCRCAPCKADNRAFESRRNKLRLYGQWQPYIDATPAREHVQLLGRNGIGWRHTAKLAGVSASCIRQLLYGGTKDREPTRQIRPATAEAILAVPLSPAALCGKALTDATGTRRRLQALVACGWSQALLAGRLGILASNFSALIRHEQVTAARAREVTALYRELWDRQPPEVTHLEKIAASRARNHARKRGWPPPMAWDCIDDPDEAPDGWQRPARLGSVDLAAEARDLFRFGLSRAQAAERLEVSRAALEKALERAPRLEAA